MSTCSAIDVPIRTSSDVRRDVSDWLLLLTPGVIWGTSFLFIAEGLQSVGPYGVAFLRIAIGFVTLSLFPAARKPIARGDWRGTIALGVLWMAFPLCMFPLAELRISTALTGMLNGSTAIFTAAVAGLIARQLPSRNIILGITAGFIGAVLMSISGARGATGDWIGVAMILAALASYGVAFNLAAPLQQRNGALPVLWRALFIGMVLTAPLGLRDVAVAQWKLTSVLALLALGALGTGVSFIAFATAAGRLGATRASATTFIIPVVALLLGVVFRNEAVTLLSIAGAAICLGGAWLIRRR